MEGMEVFGLVVMIAFGVGVYLLARKHQKNRIPSSGGGKSPREPKRTK